MNQPTRGFISLLIAILIGLVILGGAYYLYTTRLNPAPSAAVTVPTTTEKPTCTMTADKKQVRAGDSVTFSWTSTNADSAQLAPPPYPSKNNQEYPSSGSYMWKNPDPSFLDEGILGPLTWKLYFVGKNGFTECSTTVPVSGSTAEIESYPWEIALDPGSTAQGEGFSLKLISNVGNTINIEGNISGQIIPASLNTQTTATTGPQTSFTKGGETFYVNLCGILGYQVPYVLFMVSKDKPVSCPSYLG